MHTVLRSLMVRARLRIVGVPRRRCNRAPRCALQITVALVVGNRCQQNVTLHKRLLAILMANPSTSSLYALVKVVHNSTAESMHMYTKVTC
jgi:hypothetical protein